MEQTIGGHPCPVCGRTVFREYDSYEICPFCGWEDNAFQEAHPYTGGGPNASLHSCRRSYRKGERLWKEYRKTLAAAFDALKPIFHDLDD